MEICEIQEFPAMNSEFYMEKNAAQLNDQIHVHKYTEMIIFTAGKAVHVVENLRIPVETGSVVVLVPGFKHCFLQEEGTEYYIFSFDVDRILSMNKQLKKLKGMQSFFISSPYYRYRHLFTNTMGVWGEDLEFVKALCELTLEAFRKRQLGYDVIVREYFFCLMIFLSSRYLPKETGLHESFCNMEESMEYLETHYAEHIVIRQLADIAHLSERHYTRLFKKIYGRTPMSYIIKCRLDHACALLLETDFSVTRISSDCGFTDLASFSKVFKKTYGIPPVMYRKGKGDIQRVK